MPHQELEPRTSRLQSEALLLEANCPTFSRQSSYFVWFLFFTLPFTLFYFHVFLKFYIFYWFLCFFTSSIHFLLHCYSQSSHHLLHPHSFRYQLFFDICFCMNLILFFFIPVIILFLFVSSFILLFFCGFPILLFFSLLHKFRSISSPYLKIFLPIAVQNIFDHCVLLLQQTQLREVAFLRLVLDLSA